MHLISYFNLYTIYFITIVAVASAAQLPSNTYLPQNHGTTQRPSNTYLPQNQGGYQQGGGSRGGNTRPQQEIEKNAAILKQDQEINENGFNYSYETSNGIRAEEAGDATQTQGGFSYKGDDGNTYSIVFTAGEGGFRAQGDHIPVPPPTPEAILKALDQNAKDEAAGIFDDGQYRHDSNGDSKNGIGGYSSGGQIFGSANHQGSFNSGSGYHY
ncbi:hypothetical protein ABMA28_006522 [Loxostege sticticalis]|uniref:Uncharacterized protein n=1 Tax=Loxostege sticticalis TaxID=481309 RepID=A0ABD0SLH7_LOXSC